MTLQDRQRALQTIARSVEVPEPAVDHSQIAQGPRLRQPIRRLLLDLQGLTQQIEGPIQLADRQARRTESTQDVGFDAPQPRR